MFWIWLILVIIWFALVFFLPEIDKKNTLSFQLAGLVIFLIGIWLIKKSNDKEKNHLNKEKLLKKEKIKKEGIKILVNLESCNLLSKKDIIKRPSTDIKYAQALNTVLDSNNSVIHEEINKCFITYKINEQGLHKTLVSEPIAMDKDVVKIKLYMKKKTFIYYDKNTGDFFFDLKFLYT